MLIKQIFRPTEQLRSSIAFFSDAVKAGFPSPAQDYIEKTRSLDDLCIRTPAATYFVRASGSSMERAGIHDGDVLVVDRSLPPGHRKIVIASVVCEDWLTACCMRLIPATARLTLSPPALASVSVCIDTSRVSLALLATVASPSDIC